MELLPGRFADTIRVNLYKAQLAEEPVFEALSYAWGRELHDEEPAIVNGSPVTITDNFDCALRYLRSQNVRRTLWVDALCINQYDTLERNQQVPLMCFIYSNASNVIVWLHPIDPGGADRLAFDYINRDAVPDSSFRTELHDGDDSETQNTDYEGLLVQALISLCQCAWFSRLWVVQELTLAAQDPVVCCGFETSSWSQFCHFFMKIRRAVSLPGSLNIAFERSKPQQIPPLYTAIRNGSVSGEKLLLLGLSERIEYLFEVRRHGRNTDFALQLFRTGPFEATDPRDKIFGVLGISSFCDETIVPDYTKLTKQVYCEAMAMVLRESFASTYTLLPLLPLPTRTQASIILPSWVCDFTLCNKCVHLQDRNPHVPTNLCPSPEYIDTLLAKASNLTSIVKFPDLHTLHTAGLLLGTISAAIPVRGLLSFSGEQVLQMANIRDLIHSTNTDPNLVLEALLGCGESGERSTDDAKQSTFRSLLANSEDYDGFAQDQISCKQLNDTLVRTAHRRILFVTNTGRVGLTYHSDIEHGIRQGDIIAGLFGINFPFVLRSVPGASKFNMLNVAHIAAHEWGPDASNTATQDSDWDPLKPRGLSEYIII